MQYYGYPHGVLWTPACITLSSRMGLSEHWHGDHNRKLRELTSGTLSIHTGYCACSHGPCKKEPHGAIVRAGSGREVWHLEDCCLVFVRLVCHSAQHRTGRGDECLVYHPKYPTPYAIPFLVWDPPHDAQHGVLGVSARGTTLAHPAHSRNALTRACEEGAGAHECVLGAAT
jgi:hypothetical protein